jgi:DNA (cytosine-5)-methyltransferase 1
MVHGEPYAITDNRTSHVHAKGIIPGAGFPEDYIIEHDADGRPIPKQEQTDKCGNSVCPPLARALVAANVPEMCKGEAA